MSGEGEKLLCQSFICQQACEEKVNVGSIRHPDVFYPQTQHLETSGCAKACVIPQVWHFGKNYRQVQPWLEGSRLIVATFSTGLHSIGRGWIHKYTNMQSEAVWIEILNARTCRESKAPLETEEFQVAANYTRHKAFSALSQPHLCTVGDHTGQQWHQQPENTLEYHVQSECAQD